MDFLSNIVVLKLTSMLLIQKSEHI